MKQHLRKLNIWLISLAAVLLVYVVYNQISKTPPIVIETPQAEPNEPQIVFEKEVGKVGEVGIGTVDKAEFITLGKNKQVERK